MALDGPYTLKQFLALTSSGRARKQAAARFRGHDPNCCAIGSCPRKHIAQQSGSCLRKHKNSVVIGIDPGTRCVGWGVIETDGHALKLAACGCIRPKAHLELKDRLSEIFTQLEAVLARTRPQAAALEETFAGVNMKSAIAMGEGRGIALLCLARANLEVLELSPRSIKHAITGSGAASKARVAAMVAAQLRLAQAPRPADITDALAAAIALARRGG